MLRVTATLALILSLFANTMQAETLYIYNWSDYFAPDTLSRFEKETGIKVVYDMYDSNTMLEAKLYTGSTGYDLVFPNNFPYFARQVTAGVYQPLDTAKVPNLKLTDQKFTQSLFVDGKQMGAPYLWGSIGIGYNKEKVAAALGADVPFDSWAMVFKPENMAKLGSCKVAMVDSPTYILPIILNYLGLNPGSTSMEDQEKALDVMRAVRPYITYFHDSQYLNDLANGNICVAVGWSGDMFIAKSRAQDAGNQVNVGYTDPKEGAPFLFDVMAIPKDAKNVDAALKFINYILTPEVMASLTNTIGYPNPVPSSKPMLLPQIANDPAVYPPKKTMDKLFQPTQLPLAIEKQVNREWAKMKAGEK